MYLIINKNNTEVLKRIFISKLKEIQEEPFKIKYADLLNVDHEDLILYYEDEFSANSKRIYNNDDFQVMLDRSLNVTLSFSSEDNKPTATFSVNKTLINGQDVDDKFIINVSLDKLYTGEINCDIKGPLGIFPKKIYFNNSDNYQFTFFSKMYGYYQLPVNRIKAFQSIEPLKIQVSWE